MTTVLYHKSFFNQLRPLFLLQTSIGLTRADTAVSGKLILAKYVHSEIEKEEEEQVFVFFFSLLVT